MAWTATYSANGAEILFSGDVTGAQILEAKREFFAHEFPDDAHYVLCDFTAAERFDITSGDVHMIAEQDKAAIRSHARLLEVVVAQSAVVYGLSRMWQMRVDVVRPHTAVLHTRDEAIDWLGGRGITALPSRSESRPEDPLAPRDAPE